jgi:hypothetical protein
VDGEVVGLCHAELRNEFLVFSFFWLGRWYRGSAGMNHSLVPNHQGHVKISSGAIDLSQQVWSQSNVKAH